ncbi:hypothetical protein BUALT_Bualt03G0090600 [Buddleja alternifolia]|uniref:Retrovirus-related Pol polyprotein from transposon TNT 1-94-like beta-barrel domain-containing protein n=1 Tax=Buddleja alternifolia TaxID=168488 RepID=A0AAV6Y3H9_9LAMI|nr:hypothetical protein BUALT_Bualt03G0090600 [Buddleja alternifolia]
MPSGISMEDMLRSMFGRSWWGSMLRWVVVGVHVTMGTKFRQEHVAGRVRKVVVGVHVTMGMEFRCRHNRVMMVIMAKAAQSCNVSTKVSESLLANCDLVAWWVDSTSSRHVAKTRDGFVEMKEVKARNHKLYMGNNTYCDVLGIDTVRIGLPGENNLFLTDVLYAPNMR